MFATEGKAPQWCEDANESRNIAVHFTIQVSDDIVDKANHYIDNMTETGEQIAQFLDEAGKDDDGYFEVLNWMITCPEEKPNEFDFCLWCTIYAEVDKWVEKEMGAPLQMAELVGGFRCVDPSKSDEEAKLELYHFLKDTFREHGCEIIEIDNGEISIPEREDYER